VLSSMGIGAFGKTCSLCDAPVLSPMLNVEAIGTSDGTEDFQLTPQCIEN